MLQVKFLSHQTGSTISHGSIEVVDKYRCRAHFWRALS